MRFIKNMLVIVTVVMCSHAFTSCKVDEDKSGCFVETKIKFRFDKDGQSNLVAEVPSLSVFVFDKNNKFIGRWDENDNTKFSSDYTMTLPLLPGNYSFVVWGGLKDDNYFVTLTDAPVGKQINPIPGRATMSQMSVRIKFGTREIYGRETKCVDYVPQGLFFGRVDNAEVEDGGDNHIYVGLMKNTTQINLKIVGLAAMTRAVSAFDIGMTSANGRYDFWDGFAADPVPLTYVLQNVTVAESQTVESKIYTQRMKFEHGYKLTIYNKQTGREMYTADLLEDFIRKVPTFGTQQAVDAQDVFDITIDLLSALGVNVTVNGWNVGISGSIIQ